LCTTTASLDAILSEQFVLCGVTGQLFFDPPVIACCEMVQLNPLLVVYEGWEELWEVVPDAWDAADGGGVRGHHLLAVVT